MPYDDHQVPTITGRKTEYDTSTAGVGAQWRVSRTTVMGWVFNFHKFVTLQMASSCVLIVFVLFCFLRISSTELKKGKCKRVDTPPGYRDENVDLLYKKLFYRYV